MVLFAFCGIVNTLLQQGISRDRRNVVEQMYGVIYHLTKEVSFRMFGVFGFFFYYFYERKILCST